MMNISKEELLISIREKLGESAVSSSLLDHPTSEFMMTYFSHILVELGVDIKSSMNQRLVDTHNECYRDIYPYLQVYNALKEVFPIPKYFKNFTIFSLMEPKSEDIMFVALIDNFHDFMCQRMADFMQPPLSRIEQMRELLEQKKKFKEDLKQRINDAAAQKSKQENAQHQADKQSAMMDKDLEEIEEKVQRIETQLQCKRTELQGLGHEKNSLSKENEQLKNESEMLARLAVGWKQRAAFQEQCAALEEKMREQSEILRRKALSQQVLENAVATEEATTVATEQIVLLAKEAESASKSIDQLLQQRKELLQEKKEWTEKRENVQKKLKALQAEHASEEELSCVALGPDNDKKKKIRRIM